jgi:hypothetical protein
MAQNFTYATLVDLLQSYTTRSDATFTAKIPTFIALAENRVATDMKQQGFQAVVRGTFDPTSETLPKPAFWRETIAFSFIDGSSERMPLFLRSYDYCRNYNPSGAPGIPKFYADYNFSNFLITPRPNQAFAFELTYYARLQPLDDANQTNWLTLNMPQALLAACMLEAALWQKNAPETAKWQGVYDGHKNSALGENSERLADRNLVVTRG